ncbi:MAG: hypothetical protein R3338_14300, partial [Thermoanaerobaculia bacterium]|nr:hypothetical protein [Thermoanaerobaculia bacterium]
RAPRQDDIAHLGMAEALQLCGFEIVESRSRFLPYTTKSLLPQHPLLVRFYLLIRPAHLLLGKQMLVVGQRPDSE